MKICKTNILFCAAGFLSAVILGGAAALICRSVKSCRCKDDCECGE